MTGLWDVTSDNVESISSQWLKTGLGEWFCQLALVVTFSQTHEQLYMYCDQSHLIISGGEGEGYSDQGLHMDSTIRYDTIEEFNVDSKAEYTA